MYDKNLDTFLAVAESGSFSKAANDIFISHTAVIKQINNLEVQLGLRLFIRSNSGVKLTKAGELLVEKAKAIKKYANEALEEINQQVKTFATTIRVGTSLFYPSNIFLNLWDEISAFCPQYTLKIISIEKDAQRLEALGVTYDFVVGPYDTDDVADNNNFFPIGRYAFCLSMPRNHPLAKKKRLHFSDLKNHKLLMMEPGTSTINDRIRYHLQKEWPSVEIETVPPNYNLDTFNYCNEQEAILLNLECWKDVHPGLVSVPLAEDYSLPYGILTTKNIKSDVRNFVEAIQNALPI